MTIRVSEIKCTRTEPVVRYPTEFLSLDYTDDDVLNVSLNIMNQSISEPENLVRLSDLSTVGIYSEKSITLMSTLV